MKNPQTFAAGVAKNIGMIAKNGCLAMCYLYCVGIDGNADDYIWAVSNAMESKLLDNECFVLNAEKYLEWYTGKRWKVEKKQIDDITTIKEATPVRYSYNGLAHWVVVEDGKIVFNPLLNSVCVNKGHPAHNKNDPNARIIKLA